MAHIVKCRVCHKPIDTDIEKDWVNPTNLMYYHKSCYEDFAKKRERMKTGAEADVDNDEWKSLLWDYLRKDLKMGVNYVKFNSQWNSFLKKGKTAKGIFFCLKYFYEVAKGDPQKSENGIGIVPFIYDEGAKYWAERNRRDKGICDRIAAQLRQKSDVKVKVVKKKKVEPKKVEIDLSAIEDMEEDE